MFIILVKYLTGEWSRIMKVRVVADSSANLFQVEGVDFVAAPLKIFTDNKEYIDDENLDVKGMTDDLKAYRGKSGSSCPNFGDWTEAFGDADVVYGVALTSKISGAYNAAHAAGEDYMESNPGKKIFVLDSLTTGPELELIVEKYAELVKAGEDFEAVCEKIQEYLKTTHLMFSLESLQTFVNNGRVNPAVAAAAKILGICIVGQASAEGELQQLHKRRGRAKAIAQIWENMKNAGYNGGKVRLRHTFNEESAKALADIIKAEYPNSDITIGANRGLCSFYCEPGGVLVGFEGGPLV